MEPELSQRKADHLNLCAHEDVGFRNQGTMLSDVRLLHDGLPELHLDEVDLSLTLFGVPLRAPLFIAAMTGGTDEAARVNQELAALASELGLGFGLGSQRAMWKRPATAPTYRVQNSANSALILGNIGGIQAATMTTADVQQLVDSVGARALCVHLNPAMEIVQPEGDRDFRGVLAALSRLRGELSVPVIAKETGCGIGPAAARKLRKIGIEHVDVSGAGGTSWVGVETRRAQTQDPAKRALGEALWDWGIPTALSTHICVSQGFSTVIATGGITSGSDVARALALGATAAGIARPVLKALYADGKEGARHFLTTVLAELRATMLLVGARTLSELRQAPKIVTGELAVYMRSVEAL